MQSDKQLMLKHKVLVDTVQKKVRQLYGDFGLAAIKNGFDGIMFRIYNLSNRYSTFSHRLKILINSSVSYELVSFTAKYCNSCTKIAIVRVRHGPHKFLLRAIPLINDIDNKLVKTTILYVGATMKHCFLFIRVRTKQILLDNLNINLTYYLFLYKYEKWFFIIFDIF